MKTYEEFRSAYDRYLLKKIVFTVSCLGIIVVAFFIGMIVGDYTTTVDDVLKVLGWHLSGDVPTDDASDMLNYIIWDLRVPRTLGTICLGAILAVCGVAMQSAMKNPLADPYTTGIASGASFGVALLVIWNIALFPALSYNLRLTVNAFVFSLLPTAIILFFSRLKKTSPTRMILTGIAVMYMFSATTSLMMLMADPDNLGEVYRWNLGNLGKIDWDNLYFFVIAGIFCVVTISLIASKLNILSMNDNAVKSMGIEPNRAHTIVLLLVSVSTAMAVCFTGTIGFVGLVVPHMMRMVIGSDCKYLIPACAAFGGLFLVCCDLIAKAVVVAGLPVGVITSLIGAPLFIYILLKRSRGC